MIILAGYWELGYSSPLRESERWDYMLKDFGADKWYMIPVSGINVATLHIDAEEVADLQAVFDAHPGVPAVFLHEDSVDSLDDFVHPTDVIYVFGKAGYSPLGLMREGDLSLSIPTPAGTGGLWGDQAALLVLNDRFKKQ